MNEIEELKYTPDHDKRVVYIHKPAHINPKLCLEFFLAEKTDFYLVAEVARMLDITRHQLEKLMREKQEGNLFEKRAALQKYKIIFLEQREEEFVEVKSNYSTLLHRDDLKTMLLDKIIGGKDRFLAVSLFQPDLNKVKDYLGPRLSTTGNVFVYQRSMTPQEIIFLIEALLDRKIKLYSNRTIKKNTEKSQAMVDKLAKCLSHIQFVFANSKITTRFFKTDGLLDKIKIISKSKVYLVQHSFPIMELSNLIGNSNIEDERIIPFEEFYFNQDEVIVADEHSIRTVRVPVGDLIWIVLYAKENAKIKGLKAILEQQQNIKKRA